MSYNREAMLRALVNKMRTTAKQITDTDPNDQAAFERNRCADDLEQVLDNTAWAQVNFRVSDTWKVK